MLREINHRAPASTAIPSQNHAKQFTSQELGIYVFISCILAFPLEHAGVPHLPPLRIKTNQSAALVHFLPNKGRQETHIGPHMVE